MPNFEELFPDVKDKNRLKEDIKHIVRDFSIIEDEIKKQESYRIKWKTTAIISFLAVVEMMFKGHDSVVTEVLNYDFAMGAGTLIVITSFILWTITASSIKKLERNNKNNISIANENLGVSLINLSSKNSVEVGVKRNGIIYYFDPETLHYISKYNQKEIEERINASLKKRDNK